MPLKATADAGHEPARHLLGELGVAGRGGGAGRSGAKDRESYESEDRATVGLRVALLGSSPLPQLLDQRAEYPV